MREEADLWWAQGKDELLKKPNFGREEFKEALREKFYPSYLRKQKSHLYGIKGREKDHSGEKRKNPDSFQGGEKRHKPNGNHQGNFEDRRDNKGYFGKGNGGHLANARGNGNQRDEKPKRKYLCKQCEKDHPRKDCEGNPVTCRYCQKLGHREYECFEKEVDVKSGKVKESSTLRKPSQPSGPTPKIGTSSGAGPKGSYVRDEKPEVRNCSKLFRSVSISIFGAEFPSDLIEFDLKDLDVILDMDWFGKYEAKIDCVVEKVALNSPSKTRVPSRKEEKSSWLRFISAIQLLKFVKKGYPLFMCSVREVGNKEEKSDESIPVIEEFPNVFRDEIPDMPPVRDVEFTIDLVPGTGPISKAPYRMAPVEMKELKT
ncbi:uncharacterized protein LOC110686455 [Chenopodium quinoa]|uniref:uncharacterized protein LOC110686455 n=1 Tax=Chenopodium quinoa TaxID=63459 RepID=UPI000B771B15|nr:uncharacterized protein LOC110686455 [Chenopodium quinoa]